MNKVKTTKLSVEDILNCDPDFFNEDALHYLAGLKKAGYKFEYVKKDVFDKEVQRAVDDLERCYIDSLKRQNLRLIYKIETLELDAEFDQDMKIALFLITSVCFFALGIFIGVLF